MDSRGLFLCYASRFSYSHTNGKEQKTGLWVSEFWLECLGVVRVWVYAFFDNLYISFSLTCIYSIETCYSFRLEFPLQCLE